MPRRAPIRVAGKGRLMVSIPGEAGGVAVQLRGESASRGWSRAASKTREIYAGPSAYFRAGPRMKGRKTAQPCAENTQNGAQP